MRSTAARIMYQLQRRRGANATAVRCRRELCQGSLIRRSLCGTGAPSSARQTACSERRDEAWMRGRGTPRPPRRSRNAEVPRHCPATTVHSPVEHQDHRGRAPVQCRPPGQNDLAARLGRAHLVARAVATTSADAARLRLAAACLDPCASITRAWSGAETGKPEPLGAHLGARLQREDTTHQRGKPLRL